MAKSSSKKSSKVLEKKPSSKKGSTKTASSKPSSKKGSTKTASSKPSSKKVSIKTASSKPSSKKVSIKTASSKKSASKVPAKKKHAFSKVHRPEFQTVATPFAKAIANAEKLFSKAQVELSKVYQHQLDQIDKKINHFEKQLSKSIKLQGLAFEKINIVEEKFVKNNTPSNRKAFELAQKAFDSTQVEIDSIEASLIILHQKAESIKYDKTRFDALRRASQELERHPGKSYREEQIGSNMNYSRKNRQQESMCAFEEDLFSEEDDTENFELLDDEDYLDESGNDDFTNDDEDDDEGELN